jgi:hypothetical protein
VRGVIKAAASLGNGYTRFGSAVFNLAPFEYKNVPAFASETDPQAMPKNTPRAQTSAPPDDEPSSPQTATPQPPPADPPPPPPESAANAETLARLEREHPLEVRALVERGVQNERSRVAGLDRYLNHPSTAQIAQAAMRDGRTAQQISDECFDAVTRAQHVTNRVSDAASINQVPSTDTPFTPRGRTAIGVAPASRNQQTREAARAALNGAIQRSGKAKTNN